jgi:hypothetical protein
MQTSTPSLASTPELLVELTRRADGASILRCTRPDGSAVWQRQDGPHARYFPFHDLTHYAVETTLGFRHGFFGLIADGWEIVDTEGKGVRGALPPEALVVEQVVGLFDRERVGGADPLSAAEFNGFLDRALIDHPAPVRRITDAELAAVRLRIDALHQQWATLAPDSSLTLSFVRS